MSLPEVDVLTNVVSRVFKVEDVTTGESKDFIVRYRGYFLTEDTLSAYNQLEDALRPYKIIPLFRKEADGKPVIFLADSLPEPPPMAKPHINLILFIVSIFSAMLVGVPIPPEIAAATDASPVIYMLTHFYTGWPFALAMMGILFAHEMGHYLACRYYHVPATLPFFIPAPFISPFGTLGAFIAMRGIPKNKRILFDVGVAGPLAGLVVAVPVLFYGLSIASLGPVQSAAAGTGMMLEGNSLFYLFAKYVTFGKLLPEPVTMNGLPSFLYWLQYVFSGHPIPFGGLDVMVDSGGKIAWAGWGGLLVTALNLVPVGTLDGGHVVYGLFGEKARKFFPVAIGLLLAFSVLPVLLTFSLAAFNFSWLLWVTILFWLGNVRTTPLDDITPLDTKRRVLGIIVLIIFILIFTPIPLVTY
jgi:membrane-associated protease RseP (regulator of RpoE activity)